MPYGLILEIMVALILVSSAPERPTGQLVPAVELLLWILKAGGWYLLCLMAFKKGEKGGRGRFSSIGLWEWAALFPFIIDIYFLDANLLFFKISSFFGLESLKEILALLLFLFYLTVVWSTGLKEQGERPLLNNTVYSRLRLLLPVVFPYFVLIVLIDLLEKLPFPFLRQWLHSDYAPAVFLLLFLLFFLFVLPPLIMKLWRCTPLPNSDLRQRIEHILKRQKMSFSGIMVWHTGETMACTAAVMGLVPGFRYILLTPCLIRYLQPEEIEAVIAHEIEHVRRKHILWYVIFLLSYSAIIYRLGDPFITWLLSTPAILKILLVADEFPDSLVSLLTALPVGILIIVYFRFLMGYFMRNFERQADMAAFEIHGHPFFLINALKKVALLSGIDPQKPNWHHYSISERIDFLRRAYLEPKLLAEHSHKLNVSRGIFITLTCILLILPSSLPTKTWKKKAHSNVLQLYYEKLVQKGDRDPRFYLLLGEIAFEQKKYKAAELAYKKVLNMEPNSAEALNNLAWLYVKSDDPAFIHPQKALLLAMKAAKLRPEPFILDTLAECFFANGYVARAIEVEQDAFRKAHENRDYYKSQVERFKKALKEPGGTKQIN